MDTDEKRWEKCKEIRSCDVERGTGIDQLYEFSQKLNSNVFILGTRYTIIITKDIEHYPILEKNSGYVDYSIKTIVIKYVDYDVKRMKNGLYILTEIIRHEIIHAFLYESGLDSCSNVFEGPWATNEELVDFFAIQLPKIVKTCMDIGTVVLQPIEDEN